MKYFKNKKVLVTGGAGYLASNIVDLLRDVDCHVVRLDRAGAKFAPISGSLKIDDVYADVRDGSIWDRVLLDVDVVFHLASQTSVYVANDDPNADLNVNVRPMLDMLETCRTKRMHPVVIFSGTVTEVGMPKVLPVDEEQADVPVTIYDMHKLMAENYLLHYVREGIVSGTTLRLANVYGPGPRSGSADRGVLNMMICRALRNECLTIYGDGNFLRDYVYAKDVALAFIRAAVDIDSANGRYFVIGSGVGHTIAEAIGLIAERVHLKTGKTVGVANVESPANLSLIEKRNFVADSHLFMSATSWRPKVFLIDGIDRTIDYYMANG